VRTLVGNGALPSTLRDAGMDDADMLIAVTQRPDQPHGLQTRAQRVQRHRRAIARLRSPIIWTMLSCSTTKNFAVSYALCPEQVITDYITQAGRVSRSLQVLEFADGRVALVAVKAYAGGIDGGQADQEMREHLGDGVDARIAAIFRRDHPVTPTGDTVIEEGDEVFVLAAERAHPARADRNAAHDDKPVQRVIIAGGGNIGLRVAQMLEGRCTRSRSSKAMRPARRRSPTCSATAWCCSATPPTRSCWNRSRSTRPICFSP
jgi:trk system potassium uptake protein TrkA